MLSSVAADWDDESLAHQALLYGSEEEFLAGTVAFIRDGLDRGDPVRVVTTDRNRGWLWAALGADAGRVAFGESSQWYRHPVRALAAVHRTVQEASRRGQRLRMIGEPWSMARTVQENTEWARYESLVNAALGWSNAALLCTYDTGVVSLDVVAQVVRTHPELVVNGGSRSSPSYLDPAVFNAQCDGSALPELSAPALWFGFDGLGQLVILRDFVMSQAAQAGVAVLDATQFLQAIYSVATNAIEHGGASATVRAWAGPQSILCEVRDAGAGLRAPLAGRLPASRSTARGRGVWFARQRCDLVEVRSGPAGTIVRLHLTLP